MKLFKAKLKRLYVVYSTLLYVQTNRLANKLF